jgi:hypothetical protein
MISNYDSDHSSKNSNYSQKEIDVSSHLKQSKTLKKNNFGGTEPVKKA